jgi:hypothetical protein
MSDETQGIATEVFVATLSFSRQMPGMIPPVGHDRFLPNAFQLIVQQPSHHSTLCSLDSENVVNNPD